MNIKTLSVAGLSTPIISVFMKSVQQNFYLDLNDQFELNVKLLDFQDMEICKYHSSGNAPVILENTLIGNMGAEPLKILLFRKSDFANIVFRDVGSVNGYSVDTLRSPVVEYSRCYVDDEIIRRGRLYFIMSFYDEHDKLAKKSESFVTWANDILSVTRKNLSNGDTGTRFGAGALIDKRNGTRRMVVL